MRREGKENVLSITVKGVLAVVIVSLISLLAFAFFVKFVPLSLSTIKIVNQFLKALSIIVASIFVVNGKGGLIKGALIGGIGSILSVVLFSCLGGNGVAFTTLLYESLFGLIVGAISGVIAVNFKK